VGRVAELLGIKELLQRRPKELSGGQRQRVALGRAIVRQPKVFLMDEPLSNLDARLRIDMRAELKRLHRELNTTTIYVTHDQGEAMGLSDRLAVLSEGQVQQVGPPGAVYRHPANLFVAGFIGSPPMNLLPAAVSAVDASTVEVNGLVVPTPCAASLSATGRVTAGIRPEDVLVSLARREGSVEIEVLVVEPAGPSSWIDAMWNGVRIRGTASPEEPVRAGEPARMTLRTEHMVFFDRRTGGLLC
jgi:multiple sugar transport system ATP-binding protein